MGRSPLSRISSRWRLVTGTSAVGTRYSSSRVTTYIWSSLSGIWPVPVADAVLTTAGVQIRGDVPVRSAAPAATVDRELLAPRPDRDIRLLTADGDVRVGGIRDAQE